MDGDTNQVGQVLAELLDWPQATFAATMVGEESAVVVGREVDGGVATVRVSFPAVVTVDLRIVSGESVRSQHTAEGHKYTWEVRFAPLPAIMKAKRKPLDVKPLSELCSDAAPRIKYLRYEAPPERQAGVKVEDVAALVDKLANEAKVI